MVEVSTVNHVTIVSYNIHSGVGMDGQYDLERIAELINQYSPDIVALQELEINRKHQKTRRWSVKHSDNQAEKLSELCGLPYHCFACAITCNDGDFGIAVLSKFPLLNTEILMYSPFKQLGLLTKTPRNALAVQVQPHDTAPVFWLITTHLGMDVFGSEQAVQAQELHTWVCRTVKSDEHLIVGDCNMLSSWNAYKSFVRAGYADIWRKHLPDDPGHTYPAVPQAWWNLLAVPRRLDYAWLHKDSKWSGTIQKTETHVASDHNGLVVVLREASAAKQVTQSTFDTTKT
eukprot:TRINITY_DN96131_c0_g1_i1.p1 TRINITY_DN96131_c0_g1~~TRINITY_DN96131_c0_g1_i1.p1  ORF type:complete len:288 (-),score=14.95 TRINITY_DN96131_c0_g1_i1:67-930(-)